MKTITIFILFSVLLISCNTGSEKTEITKKQLFEMREISSGFMAQLKEILVEQIQKNGLVEAVSVCSDSAQLITTNYSLKKGVFIKRVSFKNRNENNIPDDFESEVLKKFEDQLKTGKLNPKTDYADIVIENEHKYLRYMKPIFIDDPCLNCHGTDEFISQEIKGLLSKRYPEDKATGYKKGDLRGAVSITKLIE